MTYKISTDDVPYFALSKIMMRRSLQGNQLGVNPYTPKPCVYPINIIIAAAMRIPCIAFFL